MTSDLIVPLSAVEPGTVHADLLDSIGGKAVNLGALLSAGFPVPQGFCLTTRAYRRIADSAGLNGMLADLDGLDPTDHGPIATIAGRIRDRFAAITVPDDIRAAIVTEYRRLGERAAVAVRSSATAEDLPFASFAGQQDTFLGVIGDDAVVAAVRRCWTSLWSDRAVTYRISQGIENHSVALAVVIQLMIDSAVAGVLFTADAVTGRRQQAVIDASPGLGEAVVSGAVTPDHFVVDTATGRVLQRRGGDRALMIRMNTTDGGTQTVGSTSTGPSLDQTQLLALTAIGARVERHFGTPQDIEWAFDPAGELWLTQSRPITTLFPLPDPEPFRPGLRTYFCFTVAQGLYRPLTPSGLSAFRLLAAGAADLFGNPVIGDVRVGPPVFVEAGQRIFADLTEVLRSRVGRKVLPRVFDLMETRSATILRDLIDRPEFSLTHRSVWPSLRRAVRIGAKYRIPVHFAQALISPAAAHRRVGRITRQLQATLSSAPREPVATTTEMLDWVETTLHRHAVPLAPKIAPGLAAGLVMFVLARRLLQRDSEPGELPTVLRGVPNNPTTEMDLRLWALAQRIRADDAAAGVLRATAATELAARYRAAELPPVITDGLTEFLAVYGHRAVAEIDLGVPRWSEDPTHILGVLANFLLLDDTELGPDAVFARSDRQAREMVARLVATARTHGPLRARVVGFALGRTRDLVGLREMPKNNIVLVLTAARRTLGAIGTSLVSAGLLDQDDDIFFLTVTEIRAAIDGTVPTGLIAARRASYRQEMRRRRVPRVLLSDGTEPEGVPESATVDGILRGVAASPGTVTGVARVILEPVGAHLEPGEILVAPSTDPGWTPLFLTAGGLVMEMGGPNSHGAVVAREYGIPAVVGVPLATERLSTGQALLIDGTAGTVTPQASLNS